MYRHFPARHELILAVYADEVTELRAEVDAADLLVLGHGLALAGGEPARVGRLLAVVRCGMAAD